MLTKLLAMLTKLVAMLTKLVAILCKLLAMLTKLLVMMTKLLDIVIIFLFLGVPRETQEVQQAGVPVPAAQDPLVPRHHPLRELTDAHKDAYHGGILQGGQGEEGGDGAEEA